MPSGIQIINNTVVTIDSEYANFVFVGKATVTPNTPQQGQFGTVYYTDVATPSNCKFVAIHAPNAFASPGFNRAANGVIRIYSEIQTTVELFYFDESANVPVGSTYGFQVFKANGVLAFDALQKYLKVDGVVSNSNWANVIGAHVFQSGRKYAALINVMPWQGYEAYYPAPNTPGPPWWRDTSATLGAVRCYTGRIDLASLSIWFLIEQDVPLGTGYTENQNAVSFMAIDVTGL